MARELRVEIVGDDRSLQRALGRSGKQTDTFGGKLSRLGKTAAFTAGGAALGGLAIGLKLGIDDWKESAKVTAQTDAVLKSTGRSAGVTAKHVNDLANSIQRKSGQDDEAVQSAENLLLTFTNVRNEVGKGNKVFDEATKLTSDLSVAFHKDLNQSAILVGKALNDPVKGLTALGRVGIQFTEGQKKTIKALVEGGHTLEAQKLIMGELQKQVGGSAEAYGKTLPGQIAIAKGAVENFAGSLVTQAIPKIQEMIAWLRDHWPEISAAMTKFWATVQPILQGFLDLGVAVVTAIQTHWSTIGPLVTAVGKVIQQVAQNVATALKLVTALLRGDWSQAWTQAKALVVGILNGVKLYIEAEAKVIRAAALALGTGAKNAIVSGLSGLAGLVGNALSAMGHTILGYVGDVAGWGARVGASLVSGILNGLASLPGRLVSLIRSAVNAVIGRINSALSFHVSVNTHIPGVGTKSFGYDSHIPYLASGGSLRAGQMAVVGERGPELFASNQSGTVFSNGTSRSMIQGSGGPVVFNFPNYVGDKRELMSAVRSELAKFQRQNLRTVG